MSEYQGVIKGKVIEVRFALSGKVAKVNKVIGDKVTRGEILASLDRKILQTELDRQLLDFEKTRANFEIYSQKNAEPQTALEKYLKTSEQAELDVSVKEVELAKMKLDQCDLISPVEGIVIDDGNITEGLFITPSNTPISILDINSFYFEFEISQSDIQNFTEPKNVGIEIADYSELLQGLTLLISDGKKFLVRVKLQNNSKLLLGMSGKATV